MYIYIYKCMMGWASLSISHRIVLAIIHSFLPLRHFVQEDPRSETAIFVLIFPYHPRQRFALRRYIFPPACSLPLGISPLSVPNVHTHTTPRAWKHTTKRVVTETGEQLSDAEIREMIDGIDRNADGVIRRVSDGVHVLYRQKTPGVVIYCSHIFL